MNKKWIIKNNKVVQVNKTARNEWGSLKRDLNEIIKLRQKIKLLEMEKFSLQKKLYSKNKLIKLYKRRAEDLKTVIELNSKK